MSVVVRRMMNLGSALAFTDEETDSTFAKLSALLETALLQLESHGGHAHSSVIHLATALVNAARNDKSRDWHCQALARQGATTVLSTLSSLMNLIPDFEDPSEREIQYTRALSPHLEAISRAIVTAHSIVIKILTSTAFLPSNTYKSQANQCCRELNSAHKAFSLRMSFFVSDQDFSARRANSSRDMDGHVLAWHQVELREACHLEPTYDLKEDFDTGRVIKAQREVFWNETYQAVVKGRPVIVKTYNAKSIERFRRDLEVLKAHRHSNLPALFGYSTGNTTTPFLAISMESFVPVLEYLPLISSISPETALGDSWKMLISMRRAAEHLVSLGVIVGRDDVQQVLEATVVDKTGKAILSPSSSHCNARNKPVVIEDIPEAFRFIYSRYQGTTMNTKFPTIDSLPKNLRPLRYALIENPAEVLRPSYAKLSDPEAQKSALARLRPNPSRDVHRNMAWPIPYDPTKPVAVGDFGRILKGGDGKLQFELLGNAQKLLGGFKARLFGFSEGSEEIGPFTWKFWETKSYETMFQRWYFSIPGDIAFDFLSCCGRMIGIMNSVPPEDVVLITEIQLDMHASSKPGLDPLNLFVQFNELGRLHRAYWAEEHMSDRAEEVMFGAKGDRSVSIRPLQPYCIKYLQAEEDELKELNTEFRAYTPSSSSALGDIGYFTTQADGKRHFEVVCNMAKDLTDFEFSPWIGNTGETIASNIWRASPAYSDYGVSTTLTWTATANPMLPNDLKQLYLFWMATNRGTQQLPVGQGELQLVTEITHQVYVQTPPNCGLRLNLFVHFDDEARPCRAYLLPSDEPWNGTDEPPQWLEHEVSIRQGISKTNTDFDPYGGQMTSAHLYHRLTDLQRSKRQPNQSAQCAVGSIGYWARDAEGNKTDVWINLGMLPSGGPNKLRHTFRSTESKPCKKVSDRMWQSKRFEPSSTTPPGPASIHYRWEESLRYSPPKMFSQLLEKMASEYDIPQEDLEFVTGITTEVFASVSQEAIEVPTGSGHYLRLYIYFPDPSDKNHGCYAYCSRLDHNQINPAALSKLDLEGFQLPNCNVTINSVARRSSLLELSKPVPLETRAETLLTPFGHRIGDIGWNAGNDAAHLPAGRHEGLPVIRLGNFFDENGSDPTRDLDVIHGSDTETLCTQISTNTWRSKAYSYEDVVAGTNGTPASGRGWWWRATLNTSNNNFLKEEIVSLGEKLVEEYGHLGARLEDLVVCIGTQIDIQVCMPEPRDTLKTPSFLMSIEPSTPLQTEFSWCLHNGVPCNDDPSCCGELRVRPRIEVSTMPVASRFDQFVDDPVGPSALSLNDSVGRNITAMFMEEGYVWAGSDTLFKERSYFEEDPPQGLSTTYFARLFNEPRSSSEDAW